MKVEVAELGRAVYTDQPGRFVLDRVPEGEWTLRFSYLGSRPSSIAGIALLRGG